MDELNLGLTKSLSDVRTPQKNGFRVWILHFFGFPILHFDKSNSAKFVWEKTGTRNRSFGEIFSMLDGLW